MPTRSGKPYQDPKKKKGNALCITNTPDGKDSVSNVNAYTISCTKDLRVRKSSRKRAISVTNVDIDNATDSNWIVSDVSDNTKQTQSDVNNCSMASNMNYDHESILELVTASSRKLRKRKSSVSGDNKTKTLNKYKEKDVTGTNNAEMDREEKNVSQNSEKDIEYCYKKKIQQNDQEDTENDINSANVTSKQLKNKKKVKNGKKKRQRKKLSPHKADLNDTDNEHTDNNANVNISQSPNNSVGKRHSNIKDITFEKEDKRLTVKCDNNDKSDNVDDDLNLNSPNNMDYLNPGGKRKSSSKNSIFDKNNILDTTYEKDKSKDTTKESDNLRQNINLVLNDSTGDTKFLRQERSDKRLSVLDNEITSHVTNGDINNSKNDAVISKMNNNFFTNTSNGTSIALKCRRSDVKNTFETQNESIDAHEKDKCFNKNSVLSRTDIDLDISDVSIKQINSRKSNIADTTYEKEDINSTYVKEEKTVVTPSAKNRKSISKINVSCDINGKAKETSDRDVTQSFDAFKKGALDRNSSIKDVTFDKNDTSIETPKKENIAKERILSTSAIKRRSIRHTMDFNNSVFVKLDSTFDITPNSETESKHKSQKSTELFQQTVNTTFDKDIEHSSKSSLISSDNSDIYKNDTPHISITSDESETNIADTTPIYMASSMDESKYTEDLKESPSKIKTPLKREGTFTKDGPEIPKKSPETPKRSSSSAMLSAGCTPYHVDKSSQKKPMLNVTRSVEKNMSIEAAPRLTRVMFCSPVNNPAMVAQEKNKIIKSSLKGSNKSFVFGEDAAISRPARKRSYTHSDADNTFAKRSRFANDQSKSEDKLARSRTTSATGKLTSTTPKKTTSPKSLSKSRPRLPNFAALHQKQFDKMESLTDYKQRKAMRARQMLTPSGAKEMLERISPKNDIEVKSSSKESTKDKMDTPSKKLPTLDSLKPAYTRFGFKLNMDFNPFSIPAKTDKAKEIPKAIPVPTLPSLTGATLGKRENSFSRREAAKQLVLREKSCLGKRSMNRKENRTIIKGVRTNRRFELQMKFRNVDN